MKKLILFALAFTLCAPLWSQQDVSITDQHGQTINIKKPVSLLSSTGKDGNEWVPAGPFGGDVVDIAINPGNASQVFIAAGYPFMRSDNEEPWQLINPLLNLSPSGIYCMEFNSDGVLFAGGHSTFGKIFKSSDQGESWQQIFITVSGGALNITIDPTHEDTMYVVTTSNLSGSVNKVITKSTDGGGSWTPLDMTSIFPIGMACNDLAVDPANSEVLVALGDGGFSYPPKAIISHNGGSTWQDITPGLPSGKPLNEVTIHNGSIYISGGQLFGGNTMGIYRSDDEGATWVDISTGFPVKVVNDILIGPAVDGSILYAATEGDGIYYTTDSGESWTYSTGGAGDNGSARKIACNPTDSSEIYAGFLSLGVCTSEDSGQNWSSSSVGIASLKLNGIEIDPNNPEVILTAFEAENSGGCYIYNPEAGDWGLVNALPATRFSVVSVGIDGRMYTWSNGPTTVAAEGLYRSADGGASWENMGPNIGPVFETQIFAIALSETDPDLIFIGGNNFGVNGWASMIYRSENAGEDWTNVYMGPENDGVKYLYIDPSSSNQVVYAAYKTETSGAGFLKSTDGGSSWVKINEGIPASAKWAGAIVSDVENPEILYGGIGGYGGTPGRVYKSEDSGGSWEAMSMTLSSYSKVSDILQSPFNPAVIYAATTLDGVFITLDGQTWTSSNDGLPASTITGFSRLLELGDESAGFYASTFSNSAFFTEVYEPGSTGGKETPWSALEFSLAPNPAMQGSSVRIEGAFEKIEQVDIYSMEGRLLYKVRVASGQATDGLEINASLTPGIYQVVISDGNTRTGKKLIILN